MDGPWSRGTLIDRKPSFFVTVQIMGICVIFHMKHPWQTVTVNAELGNGQLQKHMYTLPSNNLASSGSGSTEGLQSIRVWIPIRKTI